jgi:hypothetical protein
MTYPQILIRDLAFIEIAHLQSAREYLRLSSLLLHLDLLLTSKLLWCSSLTLTNASIVEVVVFSESFALSPVLKLVSNDLESAADRPSVESLASLTEELLASLGQNVKVIAATVAELL